MEDLHQSIASILERNRRVELDKAWERSWTRRVTLALSTYAVALALLWIMQAPLPFLSAFIPMVGYILSTLSLPWVKKRWMRLQKTSP